MADLADLVDLADLADWVNLVDFVDLVASVDMEDRLYKADWVEGIEKYPNGNMKPLKSGTADINAPCLSPVEHTLCLDQEYG